MHISSELSLNLSPFVCHSFVHPEDSNWPGLKPVDKRIDFVLPTPHRASRSLPWGNAKFSPKRKSGSPERCPERHSAPLVSQNDLFKQCKIETGEPTYEDHGQRQRVRYSDRGQDHNRGKEVKSGREYRTQNSSTSSSKPEVRPAAEHGHRICSYESRTVRLSTPRLYNSIDLHRSKLFAEKNVETSNEDARVCRSSSSSFGGLKDQNVRPSSESKFSLVPANGPVLHEFDRLNDHANRILDLFRDLTRYCQHHYAINNRRIRIHNLRLCHQATQDLENQAREEKKLKAYTELASTLSKVSAAAANPVMPALADIILKHAQCKQRAEDSFQSMGKVWAEAFDTFVTEISHAMDARLEASIRTIRQEADHLLDGLRATCSSRSLKRRRSENFCSTSSAEDGTTNNKGVETEASFMARNDGTTRGQKRRRYLDVTGFASPEQGQKSQVQQTDIKSQNGVQLDIQDILSQMKSKIDEQAQSLQRLAKENNEVGILSQSCWPRSHS
jgi:hypothetical protein